MCHSWPLFLEKCAIPGLFFFKMGHSRPLFLYFRLFIQLTVDVHYKFLPMTGFEPLTLELEVTALPTEPQPLPR